MADLSVDIASTSLGCRSPCLDTTDLGQVADALAGDLARTVLVTSSKSGSTVETDSHRRIFAAAFADAGLDPAVELARRTGRQTTFGWGPQFPHSTGQYHKGGHQNGTFPQLTGAVTLDLPVPEAGFTLGVPQRAQALGDGEALATHGRPVLRLHLRDRSAGLVALARAIQEFP